MQGSQDPATEDSTHELALVEAAKQGDAKALEQLLARHQRWVYNLALRMVHSTDDAADVTQEALLKVVTKLSTFDGRAAFRTWLYRIVVNHVINMKKRPVERMVSTFARYAQELDGVPDLEPPDSSAGADVQLLVKEAKVSCMTGMLLCLDRAQRVTFILGEVLAVGEALGAEVLGLSRDNFRQRLSRARRELYRFMHGQCGLVNEENPCRCAKKTRGFIQLGIVEPSRLVFATGHTQRVRDAAPSRAAELDEVERQYAELFRDQPLHDGLSPDALLNGLVSSREFQRLLNLPS